MTPTKEQSDRPAAAVFEVDPAPKLRCGWCQAEIDDDVNDCPSCLTPIDWAASNDALRQYVAATRG
jgi:hypothetical protein